MAMLAQIQNFNNNSIYVYFLSCIVILNYQHFSKCQRVSLIYATTIAMELISGYKWSVTLSMLVISMFIMEEYLLDDKVKGELLSNIWYKICDFLYQFIFIDMGACIVINIIISGKWLKDWFVQTDIQIWWFYVVNIIILLFTIHLLNTSKFGLYDFSVIKSYFDKFDGIKIKWDDLQLQRRFDIMVELEDKSYFDRDNSYNWFSIEFVKYKIKAFKENRKWLKEHREKKSLKHMLLCIWSLIRKFKLFRYVLRKIKEKIASSTWSVIYFFHRLKSKIRGCSTLEMQLIRCIGIEKGYDKCVVRRKFFEFFYTYLFFNGLKNYYENTQNNKRREFKKFILYVYLHSIRINMFGNEFKSIDKLFGDAKVRDWDIDEFYVAILSLTGARVTPKRMVLYPHAVQIARIDLNRALVWRNMIRDCRITESRKEPFDETEVEKVFYIIREKILPYIENNIFYGPCDGHNDWPSYGRSNCWSFTRNVYWHIWRESFTNRTGTEDDMMRIYTSLSDRTITHEHCKKYLGTAELGAVIRICDEIKGNDRMGHYKHSQILLGHDENGVTIYESTDKCTQIVYFTWDEYVQQYGKYKYFKYIKWPIFVR